jgi:hypothetical protein
MRNPPLINSSRNATHEITLTRIVGAAPDKGVGPIDSASAQLRFWTYKIFSRIDLVIM